MGSNSGSVRRAEDGARETEPVHVLKTWPAQFAAVLAGDKRHEYRRNDRDFRENDTLLLREFDPCWECQGSRRVWANGDKDACDCTTGQNPGGKYTGREASYRISYVTQCSNWGGPEGFVVLSLAAQQRADGETELPMNVRAAIQDAIGSPGRLPDSTIERVYAVVVAALAQQADGETAKLLDRYRVALCDSVVTAYSPAKVALVDQARTALLAHVAALQAQAARHREAEARWWLPEYVVWVKAATVLLDQMGDGWSQPVRVKVERREGQQAEFVFTQYRAAPSDSPGQIDHAAVEDHLRAEVARLRARLEETVRTLRAFRPMSEDDSPLAEVLDRAESALKGGPG